MPTRTRFPGVLAALVMLAGCQAVPVGRAPIAVRPLAGSLRAPLALPAGTPDLFAAGTWHPGTRMVWLSAADLPTLEARLRHELPHAADDLLTRDRAVGERWTKYRALTLRLARRGGAGRWRLPSATRPSSWLTR